MYSSNSFNIKILIITVTDKINLIIQISGTNLHSESFTDFTKVDAEYVFGLGAALLFLSS
jgi:hypothetical protein